MFKFFFAPRHGPGPDAAGRAGKSTSSSHSRSFQSELQQPSGGQLCKHCADGKMSISRMMISLKIQQELFLLSTSWNVCFQSKFCSNFTFARVLYIYYIDTITIFIGLDNTRLIIYIFIFGYLKQYFSEFSSSSSQPRNKRQR